MTLSLVRPLALTALALACGSSETPRPAMASAPAQSPASAGDLSGASRPDRPEAELVRLRAEGPAALPPLLARFDAMAPGPERDALAATIDRVAAQRYATVSRLYWYTDQREAQRAAKATGRPILSLRMLGRLDEELSCANSRFFRTILYANTELSRYLRERVVLHWASERPVPRVTIDFGDGRRLERTVTGNSAHIVLDADGRPVDVLPGMYAPSVFRAELDRALTFAATAARLDGPARDEAMRAWHAERARATDRDWQHVGSIPVLAGAQRLLDRDAVAGALAAAQRAAMMKAVVEIADLWVIDIGADPGTLGDDVALWASIGQRVFGLGELPTIDAAGAVIPAATRGPALLDAQSRALVRALDAAVPGVAGLDDARWKVMIAGLEQSMVADTALNVLRLHRRIHAHLAERPDTALTELNSWLYTTLFHTPADDAWLGLLPRTAYTALPGDGVVLAER